MSVKQYIHILYDGGGDDDGEMIDDWMLLKIGVVIRLLLILLMTDIDSRVNGKGLSIA